jgi:hypothetical protein
MYLCIGDELDGLSTTIGCFLEPHQRQQLLDIS